MSFYVCSTILKHAAFLKRTCSVFYKITIPFEKRREKAWLFVVVVETTTNAINYKMNESTGKTSDRRTIKFIDNCDIMCLHH